MKKIWTFGLLVFGLTWPAVYSRPATDSLTSLLNKISNRMESYADLKNWSAEVLSTSIEMDKHWKEKKKTIKEKIITVKGAQSEEEILKALEVKKGKTKDITKKVKAKLAIEKAKAKLKKKKNPEKESGKTDRRGFSLSLDEIIPFAASKRNLYDYTLLDDTVLYDRPVYAMDVRARVPEDKTLEGRFFIDKETLDVLKADLHPSKKHKVLKQFKMEMVFQVLPGDYFVLKEMNLKLHVGLIIKNIRREEHNIYKNYKILD